MYPSRDPLRVTRLVPLDAAQASASKLNLAGVAGIPDPQQLAHVSTPAPLPPLHLPDSRPPTHELLALQAAVPTTPALATPDNYQADPLYGDLLSDLHLALLAQYTQPDVTHEVIPELDVVDEETALGSLYPELSQPPAVAWIPDRPGDLSPEAAALLQDYQQHASTPYPASWMDQLHADSWRARHVDLLDQGWE